MNHTNQDLPQAHCSQYTPDDLIAVLAGEVHEAIATAIANHLESCSICRCIFADLIADPHDNLQQQQLQHQLIETPDNPRINQFISQLKIPPPVVESYEPGDYIGPYHVLSLIGKGGSSSVYECMDHKLNRRVAVKVLAHHSFDKERLARHEREARILAQLDHPAIVRAIEIEASEFPPLYRYGTCHWRPRQHSRHTGNHSTSHRRKTHGGCGIRSRPCPPKGRAPS